MTKFRVQFLGNPTNRGAAVLEERDHSGASVEEAVEVAATEPWPPQARACCVVDLDGREVFHRSKSDAPEPREARRSPR
jgi:hypothetical protein